MRYFMADEEGKREEMPVKVVKSSDYKTYYAHGAFGGILGSYHYRIDFYRDEVPTLEGMLRETVIEGGKELGKFTLPEKVVIREVDLSVYLSLPFAKQLRDWLDRNIENYEEEFGEIEIVSKEKPEGSEEKPEETE